MDNIVLYPDKSLRIISKPIDVNNPESMSMLLKFEVLARTIIESDQKAAAVSAIQVGIPIRVFLSRGAEGIVVNPTMVSWSNDWVKEAEGCLSFPGYIANVRRRRSVEIEYLKMPVVKDDMTYTSLEKRIFEGFESRMFQHEMDHLDGKLFIDSFSLRDRLKIASEVRRFSKLG